jgi:lysyl-tRNA synthetase, class II
MSDIRENPLRAEKRRKLHDLRAAGVDPYPHTYNQEHHAAELRAKYADGLQTGQSLPETNVKLAGRIMTIRKMGKASFFNLQDQSGQIQVYLRLEELSETARRSFELVDIGDIAGVEGFVFKTQKGEFSVHAKNFTMLCKTIEPLPEKYHGLTDVELKYRHRHLDLVMDPESRRVFETRSKIIREVRNYLDRKGFLEVETPVLQPLYGGAAAHPFKTHHRALDMELYLKISPELYLKRLIVGGFEKVYDMGKNFRNEGIDRSHNPEFTMLEYYEAYTDYEYQMRQFEDLISTVAVAVTGSSKVMYQGQEVDFTPPWTRLSVYDGLKKYADLDAEKITDGDLFKLIRSWGSDLEKPASKGEMLMEAFELKVEKHLWQPTFVMDHPVEISPLTKMHRSKPGLVERFEPFAACMEIGNAYTELNDPEDQLRRLQEQESKRVVDDEAQPLDHDFVQAIEVGMPPTGGVGIGIERIVMLLTDRPSIRDIILFPTMRHHQP